MNFFPPLILDVCMLTPEESQAEKLGLNYDVEITEDTLKSPVWFFSIETVRPFRYEDETGLWSTCIVSGGKEYVVLGEPNDVVGSIMKACNEEGN